MRSPEAHLIHPSLCRPILIAGVDRGFLILESMLVTSLVVMGGLDWRTLSMAAILVLALHPSIAWATRVDADISLVYVRSLGGQDFYAAAASLRARPSSVHPAVPALRG